MSASGTRSWLQESWRARRRWDLAVRASLRTWARNALIAGSPIRLGAWETTGSGTTARTRALPEWSELGSKRPSDAKGRRESLMPRYEITLPWGTENQACIEEVTELSG